MNEEGAKTITLHAAVLVWQLGLDRSIKSGTLPCIDFTRLDRKVGVASFTTSKKWISIRPL